ncbi:MAG: pilus assembly PilX N-terminal domain-containing protein [Gemmatimonadaceae bacterium]
MSAHRQRRAIRCIPPGRRGSALILTLVMTIALAAIAMSAIFLTSNAGILSKYVESERGFRYSAEAALAAGKSRLNLDTALQRGMPDSGYTTLLANAQLTGADGNPIPDGLVSLYIGRTGNFTGQYGNFASLVAVTTDPSGARYVRRLELSEENFARWIYWQDQTDPGCYANGEAIVGPMWSNANITACSGSPGARFTDEVSTAGVFVNKASAVFTKQPPKENQAPMALPPVARLSNLITYAQTANFDFASPTSGGSNTASVRIEFVAIDLDGDSVATGPNEGFFRVWTGTAIGVRADDGAFGDSLSVAQNQCGAFLPWPAATDSALRFVPFRVRSHMAQMLFSYTTIGGVDYSTATLRQTMSRPGARCYPAGDPHLMPLVDWARAGSDTTFYATFDSVNATGRKSRYPNGWGSWSSWQATGGAVQANLAGRSDANYLYPLSRGTNPNNKGVIHFSGTVAVSGVLRGRVTLYAGGTVTFIDDVNYATSPALLPKLCADMLGVIAANDASIADNAINSPQNPDGIGGANSFLFMSANRHFFIDGVVMALNRTFIPDNFFGTANGAQSGGLCNGFSVGSGCLYQTGGVIVKRASATFTGTGGSGYMENRTYDKCMAKQSPPYFPTTGRYFDNRYYEIDPVRFDIDDLFRRLTPAP